MTSTSPAPEPRSLMTVHRVDDVGLAHLWISELPLCAVPREESEQHEHVGFFDLFGLRQVGPLNFALLALTTHLF